MRSGEVAGGGWVVLCVLRDLSRVSRISCLCNHATTLAAFSTDVVPGFAGATDDDELQRTRPEWKSRTQFFMFLLGYAIGIGNLWRFPYLCGRYGGGAFVVVYLCCLTLVAAPLFFYEMVIGQTAQLGPVGALAMVHPWVKNVAYLAVTVISIICSYYYVVVSWGMRYLYEAGRALFTNSDLPWQETQDDRDAYRADIEGAFDGLFDAASAASAADGAETSTAGVAEIQKRETKAAQYFNGVVLERSDTINASPSPVWGVALPCIILYAITGICLSKGIHGAGKVAIFTVVAPCFLLVILLLRVVFLPGIRDGLEYYLLPKFSAIYDLEVWIQACGQIVFFIVGKHDWHRHLVLQSARLQVPRSGRADDRCLQLFIFPVRWPRSLQRDRKHGLQPEGDLQRASRRVDDKRHRQRNDWRKNTRRGHRCHD